MSAITTRPLTNKQKAALAGLIISAAADELGRRYAGEDWLLPEALAGVSYQQAREMVAAWMSRLPGDQWDKRLGPSGPA